MPTDHDTLIEIKSSTAETREDVKELRTDMREHRAEVRDKWSDFTVKQGELNDTLVAHVNQDDQQESKYRIGRLELAAVTGLLILLGTLWKLLLNTRPRTEL